VAHDWEAWGSDESARLPAVPRVANIKGAIKYRSISATIIVGLRTVFIQRVSLSQYFNITRAKIRNHLSNTFGCKMNRNVVSLRLYTLANRWKDVFSVNVSDILILSGEYPLVADVVINSPEVVAVIAGGA
jgi:hypothetical protein